MIDARERHRKWMQSEEYRAAYEALAPEFELARALIGARSYAGLTQAEMAERMDTTQSAIARLEGGRSNPSIKTLHKVAQATGTRLKLSFMPDAEKIPNQSPDVS